MTLSISSTEMTSDLTHHTAQPDIHAVGWEVSWMPGTILTRNEATTAMRIAEEVTRGDVDGKRWTLIVGWCRELDLMPAKVMEILVRSMKDKQE